eukprot:2377094-Amphidinium_carterae.1
MTVLGEFDHCHGKLYLVLMVNSMCTNTFRERLSKGPRGTVKGGSDTVIVDPWHEPLDAHQQQSDIEVQNGEVRNNI